MLLTPEQEMIRDSIRAYVRDNITPNAAEWDRNSIFPRQALKELGELGALGMTIPEEWGGAGLDYLSLVLALEEIAAGDGATSTIISVQNSLPCGITYKYGTDAQKERYLKPLARGEMLGCFCLTEPHAGSDASNLKTAATRDGDHWVLNGAALRGRLAYPWRQALHHHRQACRRGHRLRGHRQDRRKERHLCLHRTDDDPRLHRGAR